MDLEQTSLGKTGERPFSIQTHPNINSNVLDALRKEVSCLGNVVRGAKSGSELVGDADSRGLGLSPETEDANHGKTAVLELLQALLLVLLRGVVKAKWVPPSFSLADTEVTRHVVGTLLTNNVDSLDLEIRHEEEDLEDGSAGDLRKSLKGVGVGVRIEAGVLVAGKSSEETRGDETNYGNLGDTAVDELGLPVPGKVTELSSAALKPVEPGTNGNSGEAKGIEADVSKHRSIESSRGSGEWKCLRRASICPGISTRRGSTALWEKR